jgi:multicomponent Na+:H+ antiporter subunit D
MVVALVAAIATVLARPVDRLQRALSVASAGLYGLAVLALARSVVANGAIAYQLSDWPAPFGITLVADELAVFMLGLTAVVSLAAVAFGVVYMDDLGQRVSFHPLYHFMILGVTGSFLTGDIFNLFVWFEVMLMPSYLFVAFYSRRAETGAALEYVVLNLIGSALMLVAIGGLYATTGTLNMADMARRLANAGEFGIDPAPVLGLAAVLFAVFALKAGIVPFQFWVPGAYRAAPAPIAAVLAGVTKKVGIYAIVRLYFTVFAAGTVPGGLGGLTGQSFLAFFGPLFVLLGAASIVIGGLGAVNQADLDGVFAHSSISQVGFIVLPLGLAAAGGPLAVVGVTAALVYSLNHAVAKALLFLLSGAIYDGVGSIRFADLGGLTGRAPVLSGAFFLGGLALVGIPPLSGFFGKLLVFDTAGRTLAAGVGGGWFALAAALGGALLTIAYVSRTWSRGFWGEESDAVVAASNSRTLVAVVALLAVVLVAIGVGFDPVFRAAEGAAEAALDTGGYVDLVDPARASEVIADRTGGAGGNVTEAVGAGQPTGGLAGVIGR